MRTNRTHRIRSAITSRTGMAGDLSLIFRNERLSLARPIRTKTSSFTGTARNQRILRLLHADAETAKSGGNKRSVAMNSNPDSHFSAFSELYASADLESASTFAGFCDVNLHFSKTQLSGTLRLGSRDASNRKKMSGSQR